MANSAASLWARSAWIDGAWRNDVLMSIDGEGRWTSIAPGVSTAPPRAKILDGPVLPGVVNAHSHAFQRAFAGQAEYSATDDDDFWSWRDRMYAIANRITPNELTTTATALYREMLRGGYTHVCEFHYLQHAPDGSRYDDRLAMIRALVAAASATGIGLTVLPVLYERAGFRDDRLRDDQRRFMTSVEDVVALRDGVRALGAPHVEAGVAIHSLRAARPASIERLIDACAHDTGPIHIHVAEQLREVDDCIAATGRRPIEWLTENLSLDARWQLVHATHALPHEIDDVAQSGAGVVLCPTTEANLGDGLPDLPHWLHSGARLAIGSDSQVTRDWREELRLLEYGQRLAHRRRNVAATSQQSSAARLFDVMLEGSAAAAGLERWGFVVGSRADLLMVDPDDEALRDVPAARRLDAVVFVSPSRPFQQVMVAGRWVI
ncbi:MAG TPA: formimidoylglutamate deiminase [Casimicrobiaceae bacterium]|nr:formimidoylglutamate deiminase [Casimicrobiaceae bacterium]